jgi:hypothetical protein
MGMNSGQFPDEVDANQLERARFPTEVDRLANRQQAGGMHYDAQPTMLDEALKLSSANAQRL